MDNANKAVGVFDTGLGGLCAVRELIRLMPNENIVYFGDSGRVPYGNRSPGLIRKYAAQDMRFLLSHDVKLIVIACGTVSSVAIDTVEEVSGSFPVVGVVGPSCERAVMLSKLAGDGRIGVLGTAATIKRGAYRDKIAEFASEILVMEQACPLLVPLVENGFSDIGNPVTTLTLRKYLDAMYDAKVKTVILGCTHYPMLLPVMQMIMPETAFIDSGVEAAKQTRKILRERGEANPQTGQGTLNVYVSDEVYDFKRMASDFLGFDISGSIHKVDIEEY